MTEFIRISSPCAGLDEPRRLNPFPGRYLSEREFELLQGYVDDRIAPLVSTLPAGIINGMEVRHEDGGNNAVIHVQPGVAVGGGGRLVRLYYPLRQKWSELVEAKERQQDRTLHDGLYFLILHEVVEEIDKDSNREPCTRTELDPTRERRLETLILADLRLITSNPRLMAMQKQQAANHICARFLSESPHDPVSGDIPVALVKVTNKNMDWIDTVAGRYLSGSNSACRTFLAHTMAHLEQWMENGNGGNTDKPLAALLDMDYLPAAGPLPRVLLENPAGARPEEGDKPRLLFNPADMKVELAPVPASTVSSAIEDELPRGAVDLAHGLGEHIRLLLAIPDLDYNPRLMDLPERDTELEKKLFKCSMDAIEAWLNRKKQWHKLFNELTIDEYTRNQGPYYTEEPEDKLPKEWREDKSSNEGGEDKQNASPYPQDPEDYRNSLVADRESEALKKKESLPEPYISHNNKPHPVPEDYKNFIKKTKEDYKKRMKDPATRGEGLLKEREKILDSIKGLEGKLDESYKLLNEINDYLGLQRQHLDSITISFSTLAGGVPGDGSGSSMMRWNGAVAFDTTPKSQPPLPQGVQPSKRSSSK